MLLRFRFGNHRSFRDVQELSMVAANLKGEDGYVVKDASGLDVLPVAVIYGANASGKSNVVDALSTMRSNALFSAESHSPQQVVKRRPFSLDNDSAAKPSSFEVDFSASGTRYQYGFELADHAFEKEFLNAFPHGRTQKLFERTGQDFDFGRNLQGQNRVIAGLTRPDRSFVAAASANNHVKIQEMLLSIADMQLIEFFSYNSFDVYKIFKNREIGNDVINFLRSIDSGIIGLRKNKHIAFDTDEMEDFFEFNIKIQSEGESLPSSFSMIHAGHDGANFPLPMRDESAGTRRLLVLLAQVYLALDTGTLLVVDELDAHLHTQACDAILGLFASPNTNPKGAQLICTTHDTNLLLSPHLRRDQIWFTEKNEEGATSLYPLSDYQLRKGDNIEKGYLQGRFGAVPFSGSRVEIVGAD